MDISPKDNAATNDLKQRADGTFSKDGDITWYEGRTKYGTRSEDGNGGSGPQPVKAPEDELMALASDLSSSAFNLQVPIVNRTGLTVEGPIAEDAAYPGLVTQMKALKAAIDKLYASRTAGRSTTSLNGEAAIKQHKLDLAAKNTGGASSSVKPTPTPAPVVKPVPAPAPMPATFPAA